MIIIEKRDPTIPVETTMTLAGKEFPIELLPWAEKDQMSVFSEFRKQKRLVNPVTKNIELIPYLDFDTAGNDKKLEDKLNDELDRVVRKFSGIAGRDKKELDGTKKENKILLGSVTVEDTEDIVIEAADDMERAVIKQKRVRSFRVLIFQKCAELAKTIAEADEKNSGSSPANIAVASQ